MKHKRRGNDVVICTFTSNRCVLLPHLQPTWLMEVEQSGDPNWRQLGTPTSPPPPSSSAMPVVDLEEGILVLDLGVVVMSYSENNRRGQGRSDLLKRQRLFPSGDAAHFQTHWSQTPLHLLRERLTGIQQRPRPARARARARHAVVCRGGCCYGGCCAAWQ